MLTIYNLSSLCMLTANGIFFFLARCVYVLLWRCNTSLTGLVFTRRLFVELLIFFHISSLIDSAKDSTHFLLSASTISFPVCTTVLYSFFLFVLVLSHVVHLYILWWANIYILTVFQILCNCVLVKFISFTAWVLTYSRLVGEHFNQHTHTQTHTHTHPHTRARARASMRPCALKCFQTYIWTMALILCR